MLAPNPNTTPPRRPPGKPMRPVKAVGRQGKVYGVFPHAGVAARAIGVNRNSVINALRGGTRSGGYFWRYADAPDAEQPINPNVRRRHAARAPIPAEFRVRPVVVAPTPAPRPSERQVAYANPDPIRPVVATVVVTDEGTPARAGMDAAAFVLEGERGRFEKARAYNPLLTWGDWQKVQERKPYPKGRKRRASPDAMTEPS